VAADDGQLGFQVLGVGRRPGVRDPDDLLVHVYADVDAHFTVRAGSSGVSVTGSGYASGGVYLVGERVTDIGAGFQVTNSGFDIELPVVPDLRVRW
jgi:hypothetical protein